MATQNIVAQILLPKRKTNPKGTAATSTFSPSSRDAVLSAPDYRDHLTDIFTERQASDSRALLKDLVKYDPDVSAALHAYMTVANTTPRFYVYNANNEIDRAGQKTLDALILALAQRHDYSTGFEFTQSMREIAENMRYMALLRGGIACELIFDKTLLPYEFRNVDLADLAWYEREAGKYKPEQETPNTSDPIPLDIPNFFVKYYRQNPTEIYTESMFVSSINTIAARQQVINDLYRIMQKTGYPRIEVTVLEDVLRKNAPAEMAMDEAKMTTWLNNRLASISNGLSDMRADAAWVHTDAVEAKILNDKGPGASMNVTDIIEVLNSQNQAALKTMATVIGRGEAGVNTASVEARIFSLAAESLNGPIADLFSDALTLALRLTGYEGYVVCKFDPVELRPATELEPQLTMRQSRMLQDLSLGTISDDEYHMLMFGRPRPDASPELSGTGFMPLGGASKADEVSPNSDPMGRSITPSGSKSARSNTVK